MKEIISAILEKKNKIHERKDELKAPHDFIYTVCRNPLGEGCRIIAHQYYETTYGLEYCGITEAIFKNDPEKILKKYSRKEVLEELSKPVIDNEFKFVYRDGIGNSYVSCDFEGNGRGFTSRDDALECYNRAIYMRIKQEYSDKEWCKD